MEVYDSNNVLKSGCKTFNYQNADGSVNTTTGCREYWGYKENQRYLAKERSPYSCYSDSSDVAPNRYVTDFFPDLSLWLGKCQYKAERYSNNTAIPYDQLQNIDISDGNSQILFGKFSKLLEKSKS